MRIRTNNILFILLFPVFLYAENDDFQTWNSLELKTKLLKKTDFIFEGGLRLSDNSKKISTCFTDLNVKRRYNDMFSYSVGYRYILKSNNQIFSRKNRFYTDLNIKYNFSQKIGCSLRTRLQSQTDGDFAFNQSSTNKVREKIKFTYDINSIDCELFLSSELFYVINGELEKLRYASGVEKAINKNINLSISGVFQQAIDAYEDNIFVFRCKFRYKI
tara:strand:+ start:255 stop:905 length:651 start_codon:yes stop_codon:yes gene_type:complete